MTEERLEAMREEHNSAPKNPTIKPRFPRESTYDYEARVVAGYYGLAIRSVFIKTAKVPEWEDGMLHDHFTVILERESFAENGKRSVSKTMETRYHASAKDTEEGLRKNPPIYSILSCLQKYDVGTFENFCADFGYDTDSRRAEKTYKAVRQEYEDFSALFPEGIPEEILDIA